MVRFGMNMVMNSVIHQKNRLTINQPKKLWPLLRAIEAGKNATATQITTRNTNNMPLITCPSIVIANIKGLLAYYCTSVSEVAGQNQ